MARPRKDQTMQILLITESPKPKYNWRKHVKPKTATQNIINANVIESEINEVHNLLVNLVDLNVHDVSYHLGRLNRKLQMYLK
tara:strand:+ start:137 stop:385 length:249 start_codon:yes stop_codon:yes gene_type:complete